MQRRSLLSALAGLLLASAASAGGDGAIEINAVTAAGNFPVVISQPGLYRLTSNLDASGAATVLIQVSAADVTLDLNGFALSNGGYGVYGIGDKLSVRNGSIHSMSFTGIYIDGSSPRIEALRVNGNGSGIFLVGDGGLVLDSIVSGNSGYGITAHSGTIRRIVAASNGGPGLDVIGTATPTSQQVTECVVHSNASHAIGAVDAMLVGNLIVGNTGRGVQIYTNQVGATGLARNVFSNNSLGAAWGPGGIATGPNACSGFAC